MWRNYRIPVAFCPSLDSTCKRLPLPPPLHPCADCSITAAEREVAAKLFGDSSSVEKKGTAVAFGKHVPADMQTYKLQKVCPAYTCKTRSGVSPCIRRRSRLPSFVSFLWISLSGLCSTVAQPAPLCLMTCDTPFLTKPASLQVSALSESTQRLERKVKAIHARNAAAVRRAQQEEVCAGPGHGVCPTDLA